MLPTLSFLFFKSWVGAIIYTIGFWGIGEIFGAWDRFKPKDPRDPMEIARRVSIEDARTRAKEPRMWNLNPLGTSERSKFGRDTLMRKEMLHPMKPEEGRELAEKKVIRVDVCIASLSFSLSMFQIESGTQFSERYVYTKDQTESEPKFPKPVSKPAA